MDYFDPLQIQKFKDTAISQGKDPARIDMFIKLKQDQERAVKAANTGLVEPSEVIKKYGYGIANKLTTGSTEKEVPAESAGRTAELQAGIDLAVGLYDTIDKYNGVLGPIKGTIRGKIPYDVDAQTFQSEMMTATQIIGKALEGGVLRQEDVKKYEKILPKISDTPEVARNKIAGVLEKLQNQLKARQEEMRASGYKVPEDKRTTGETLQKPDDIGYRTTKDGTKVENNLIKFLSDSEFLPIAGSIAGGLAGSGLMSVPLGAAGAVAGKAMQQGLRELFEPERQDMSDMARAIVTEGITDAVLGGMFFGVGVGGKIVLSKVAKPLTEWGESVVPKLVQKGLPISKKTSKEYTKAFGTNLFSDIAEKGIPKGTEEARKIGQQGFEIAYDKLNRLLEMGSTPTSKIGVANTKDVITILKDIRSSVVNNKKILPAAEAGVREIDKYISFVKGYGKEMPLQKLNPIKQGLQESFKNSLEVAGKSKGLVQDAATAVTKYINTFGKEIKGTNKELRLYGIMKDIPDKALTQNIAGVINVTDALVGSFGGFPVLAAKKAVELLSKDPLMQARIINWAMKQAQKEGNKQMMRHIIRVAMRLGVAFGISGEDKPNEEQQSLPETPSILPGGGGNPSKLPIIPHYMYR